MIRVKPGEVLSPLSRIIIIVVGTAVLLGLILFYIAKPVKPPSQELVLPPGVPAPVDSFGSR